MGEVSSWVVEGFSLIEDGRPALVPFDMGVVTCRHQVNDDVADEAGNLSCIYYGANEINFNLLPISITSNDEIESHHEWRVQIISATNMLGNPDELLMETTVKRLFLYDNAELIVDIEEMAGPHWGGHDDKKVRVSKVGSSKTSVNLMRASSRRGPWDSHDMEGFWEMYVIGADGKEGLLLSLKVNRLGDDHFSCQLNGANIHSFRFTQLYDASSDAVDMGLISSTTLSSLLQREETDVIAQLGSTTNIKYDTNGPKLVFTSGDNELIFTRNPHVVLHNPFHSSDSTFWQAMPETLLVQNSSALSVPLPSSLVVELVLSDFSVLLDVIIDGRRLLRFTELSTLGKPLTLVTSLDEPLAEVADATSSIRAFLEQVQTVETYDNERYLSVVGLDGSMSFRRVSGPTPGLWVLDTRYSKIGNSLDALTRRASLRVTNEGEVLRGSINVADGVIRFRMDNAPVLAGRGVWTVEEVAVRPSSTPEAILIEQFMQSGPLEISGVRGESLEALVISGGGKQLVFLHPSDLSSVLVGSWMMHSHSSMPAETLARVQPVELVLKNSGVGHLKGRIILGGQSHALTMDEVLTAVKNDDDVLKDLPSSVADAAVITWNIYVSGTPHIHHRHNHHDSTTHDVLGHEVLMKDLSRTADVRVIDGELVIRSTDGHIVHLRRVVPRRTRYMITGEWELLFAAMSEDILKEGAVEFEELDMEMPLVHFVVTTIDETNSTSSDSLFNVDMINHRTKSSLAKSIMIVTPDSAVTFSNTTIVNPSSSSSDSTLSLLEQFMNHDGSRMMEVSRQDMLIADSESMVALTRVRDIHHNPRHRHHGPTPPAAAHIVEDMPVAARKKDVMTLVRRRLQAAQQLEAISAQPEGQEKKLSRGELRREEAAHEGEWNPRASREQGGERPARAAREQDGERPARAAREQDGERPARAAREHGEWGPGAAREHGEWGPGTAREHGEWAPRGAREELLNADGERVMGEDDESMMQHKKKQHGNHHGKKRSDGRQMRDNQDGIDATREQDIVV